MGGRTYAFAGWSDGRPRSHTIATPATATTYTATFRDVTPVVPASPLVPLALPAALPAPRLAVRAPARITWAAARRRGIPVRVRGVAGARVRAVVRAGKRRLGSRSVRVGPSGTRLIRVRLRRGASERRRRVRIDVSAVTPAGRRIEQARRVLLVPRG